MHHNPQDAVQTGRDAVARRAWREAFELLTQADGTNPLAPEDLELFTIAAFWTGHLSECIPARERAYAAYVTKKNLSKRVAGG
jgi:hypothetical protein